jgi:hypothetical protein
MSSQPIPALIAGPYAAPKVRPGGHLTCRLRGDVVVDGLTDAPVPWPYTKHRGHGSKQPILIVTGDLERAIRAESREAIAHHFGVARTTASRWRRALDVDRLNDGTRAALLNHAHTKLSGLTPRRLAAVRSLIVGGRTNQEIEASTGVPWRTVWRIRVGRTWVER